MTGIKNSERVEVIEKINKLQYTIKDGDLTQTKLLLDGKRK